MAIVFLQQKNFQRKLVLVFIFSVVITLIIVWQGVLKKQSALPFEESSSILKKEIKIDFNKLISQDMKDLVPFLEIEPFEEIAPSETEEGEKIPGVSIGRGNPFLPY